MEPRCCGLFASISRCRGVLVQKSRCRGFLVLESGFRGFLVLESGCRGSLVLESDVVVYVPPQPRFRHHREDKKITHDYVNYVVEKCFICRNLCNIYLHNVSELE